MKNMRLFYKALIALVALLFIELGIASITNNMANSSDRNTTTSSSSSSYSGVQGDDEEYNNRSSQSSKKIDPFGMWKDNDDGAALSFNSNGTGRYVYADPKNPDTDDHFTWDYIGDNQYRVKLEDPDVTGDVIATFHDDGTMTLSGDSDWNTETFRQASPNLNLDDFLEQHDN